MTDASPPRHGYVIGVVEYGEVRLFDDMAAALRDWGQHPNDVLSEVIVFYDSDAVWLKPILHEVPRRAFRLRSAHRSVTLERCHELDPSVDPLSLALSEANTLVPNRYFSSLEEMRALYPWKGF